MVKVITLDSQVLNTVSLCERRCHYTFVDSIVPEQKAEALERGDLMHKMLEIYETIRCGLDGTGEVWKQLIEFRLFKSPEEPLVDFVVRAGRLLATKMDLGAEEVQEVIHQFQEFIEYYKDDPWETLTVESIGTRILHEDEEYQFIYSYKIDRLAKRDQIIAPWDYKTSKQRKTTSSLSNQFIGYAWATDSHYVVVDKIGFQKTLQPSERFQRIILSYDAERIAEWKENAIEWARDYARVLETGKSRMNLTSCDKYSGCIYRPICEKSPSARQWIIERDYKRAEAWDPGKMLESA